MSEVGVEIVKTEEVKESGIKYLNINVSNSEVERNPDIVRLRADAGILEYAKPKTGHWILPVQDDGMSDPIYYQVRCSKCGFDLDPQTWHQELHQYDADKYCPKCGAKMFEPQESEE